MGGPVGRHVLRKMEAAAGEPLSTPVTCAARQKSHRWAPAGRVPPAPGLPGCRRPDDTAREMPAPPLPRPQAGAGYPSVALSRSAAHDCSPAARGVEICGNVNLFGVKTAHHSV